MDVYEAINARRTIRDFQDKEVPMDIIKKILEAGLKAPTNDHMRNWEFVVLTDKEEKAKVIGKIPRSYTKEGIQSFLNSNNLSDPCQREMYMDAIPKQYSMLYYSGCLILPFFRQDAPLLKPDSLSSLNSFASIWLCIENILLAAVAEGVYGVIRIPFQDEIEYIKNVIGHPDNYTMPCYISLGYPIKDTKKYTQHEINITDRLHINRW